MPYTPGLAGGFLCAGHEHPGSPATDYFNLIGHLI